MNEPLFHAHGDSGDAAGATTIGLALVLVFASLLFPVRGFDIFYHLAVGDWILDNGSIPRNGLFSATKGDTPWVDHEWGFQVLVSLAARALGWAGLVVLKALLVTGALGLLAVTLTRRGVSRPVVGVLIGIAWITLGDTILRPQLVTYVLSSAFILGTTDLLDDRSRAPVLYLPPLAALWANLHGGFIIGLTFLGIPAFVELARRLFGRPRQAQLRNLWIAFALSTAACLLNPYGWRQLYYPLEYQLRPAMTQFNLEWQPTVLAHQPALMLLFAVVVVAMALAPRRPSVHDLCLALAFAAFAVQASRHRGLAAFVLPAAAAPAIAGLTGPALRRMSAFHRRLGAAAIAAALVATFFHYYDLPRRSPFRFSENIALPVRSVEFVRQHRPPGRLFNQYAVGGYLMYRFSPDAVVFVDGRNDLYGEAFMADYLEIARGGPRTLEILDRHGVGTALLDYHPNTASLLQRLLGAGWVCVHYSAESFVPEVVLVRPTEEARPLIERFAVDLPLPG